MDVLLRAACLIAALMVPGATALGHTVPVRLLAPGSILEITEDPNLALVRLRLRDRVGAWHIFDRVLLSTSTTGLVMLAEALPEGVDLYPLHDDAARPFFGQAFDGDVGHCIDFQGGFLWGWMHRADLNLDGLETVMHGFPLTLVHARRLPIEPPPICRANREDAGRFLVGNFIQGILGVGPRRHDCGAACAESEAPQRYFALRPGDVLESIRIEPYAQMTHPALGLGPMPPGGVVLRMPAIDVEAGEDRLDGTLEFALPEGEPQERQRHVLDANGRVRIASPAGTVHGVIDSALTANALPLGLPHCGPEPDYYCPPGLTVMDLEIESEHAVAGVSIAVGDAIAAFQTGKSAVGALARDPGRAPGLGLPFFFGREVVIGLESADDPNGYVAF